MANTPNPAYSDTFVSRHYFWRGTYLMVNVQRLTVPNPGYAQALLAQSTHEVTDPREYEVGKAYADALAQDDYEASMGA